MTTTTEELQVFIRIPDGQGGYVEQWQSLPELMGPAIIKQMIAVTERTRHEHEAHRQTAIELLQTWRAEDAAAGRADDDLPTILDSDRLSDRRLFP